MLLIKILSKHKRLPLLLSGVYGFHSCPGRELLSGPELKVFAFKVLKGKRGSGFAMRPILIFLFVLELWELGLCQSENLARYTDFNLRMTGFGKKVNAEGYFQLRGVTWGQQRKRASECKCGDLVQVCWLNAGIFFPQRDTTQVIGEKRSLNGLFNNKKSNLGILESDLHSAHNDDSFTAVIGLIT